MKRPIFASLLLSLSLVGLSCEGGCSGCSSSPKASTQDAAASDARTEVFERGKEPRIELHVGRWHGLNYTWQVVNDSSFGVEGQKPVKAPVATADFTFRVTRGTANPVEREHRGKELRLVEELARIDSIRVTDKNFPTEFVESVNDGLKAHAGTVARVLTAEDGEVVELSTELVSGREPGPQEKDVLDRVLDVQRKFPFRLPDGPVGVGAKWRFSETTEILGLKGVQIAEMHLIEISEKQAVVNITVRQHAPRQEFVHPFEPGQSYLLDQYRGDANGQLTIDRLTGIPVASRLSLTGRLTVSDLKDPLKRLSLISATVLRSSAVISGDNGAGAVESPKPEQPNPGESEADEGSEEDEEGKVSNQPSERGAEGQGSEDGAEDEGAGAGS